MVYVNSTEISIQSERVNESKDIKRSLNNSIGILLRSYTDSINKELGRTGSLFRQKTKAVCLDPDNGIIPAWYTVTGSTMIPNRQLDDLYPQVCFNYIHYNPVVSGLVKNITSWKYSSVHEFLGVAGAKLINKQRAEEFGLRLNSSNQSIK
jgi:putative transposase